MWTRGCCEGRKRFASSLVRLGHGSAENVKSLGGSGTASFFLVVYFSYLLGDGGWMGGLLVFMVSMEHDGSNILENKQAVAESHTLSLALLHAVRLIHSITCARVCRHAHSHKLTHTHHLVTLWWCRHCPPNSKQTSQMKAQLHIRVGAPLTS